MIVLWCAVGLPVTGAIETSVSVFSFLHTLTTWHCLQSHSPAARRCRRSQSYLLPARPTAANLQQRVCCCGPVLGQTDGRTPFRYTDPAPHTLRTVRITMLLLLLQRNGSSCAKLKLNAYATRRRRIGLSVFRVHTCYAVEIVILK